MDKSLGNISTEYLVSHSGSLPGPFRIRSGSVRDAFGGPFGMRWSSVRTNFGPKFSAPKIKNFKSFNLCGRRRRGGGPPAAVPSPAARRDPAAAATAAQIEFFCEKVGGRLDLGVGLRFPETRLLSLTGAEATAVANAHAAFVNAF